MPIKYAETYLNARLVEEYDNGHGEELCCGIMASLIELSNGFIVGNEWDECWNIPLFIETRGDIDNHICEGINHENQ